MAQLTSYTSFIKVFSNGALTAAGSSAVDGLATNSINMTGYDGCVFIADVTHGGTGGALTFSVRQTTASIAALTSGGQGTALSGPSATVTAGSSATADTVVVEVYRPRDNYGAFLHGQWAVASSCSVIGRVIALPYHPRAAAESTALDVLTPPQSTAASSFSAAANSTLSGIAGVVRAVSPST